MAGRAESLPTQIERHQAADRTYLEEGIRLLELARNAQRLFLKQPPREQRRLAQTNALAARSAARRGSKRTNSESWLGFVDTYRTLCIAPPPEIRRVFQAVGYLGYC